MDREVVEFLIRAKRATYAGRGAETAPSREKSHDLTYREGDLMYYDTYLGSGKFAGEEALWREGRPSWSMNYIGRVTGEGFDIGFLREALLRVPEDRPFRGPERFVSGELTYSCEVSGSFEWFQGNETVFRGNSPIYECVFHGGLVE